MHPFYLASFAALIASATALPAFADCSQDTGLHLPRAREGALGYSTDKRCLYLCDGANWKSQCDGSSGGGGGTTTPPVTPINLCLEAEDSAVSGNRMTYQTSTTGGTIRGSFGNASEFLIFDNIPITTAGTYTLQIYYASAEDATAAFITNGGAITNFYMGTSYILGNGTSWTTVAQRNTTTSLISGANQIRVQGSGGNAFNLDKICLVGPN